MKNEQNQIAIVTVNYNKAQSTRELIESLEKSEYKDFTVHIVDNNSSEECQEELRKIMDKSKIKISIIHNNSNSGWGMAINQAVDWITEPLTLVLNNDTRVKPNTIGELVKYMKENTEVGICGTRILNEDGTLATAGGRFDWITRLTGITRENKARHGAKQPVILGDTEYVDDCAWIILTDVMRKPEGRYPVYLFLYFEELYLIRAARQMGYKIAYNPLAEVVHS